ncbi:MAG: thrombospondin type 3 repeat-containing protein [bacterium]
MEKTVARTIWLIVIIAVLMIAGLLYLLFSVGKDYYNEMVNDVANQKVEEITGNDIDGDGLTAEEEKLYGTNDTTADTDSDGYSDYDEIQNGFDPLLNEAALDNAKLNPEENTYDDSEELNTILKELNSE